MKEIELIISDSLKSGARINQSELSRTFGVSRSTVQRLVKKLALSLVGDVCDGSASAENPDRYDIAATPNGAVSATPRTIAPVSVGDVWAWGVDPSSPNKGLIVGVDLINKAINISKFDGYKQQLSVTSFKNWKKRPNLKHVGIEHKFIAAQDLAVEQGQIKAGSPMDVSMYGREECGSLVRWDIAFAGQLVDHSDNYTHADDTAMPQATEDTSQIESSSSVVKDTKERGGSCPFKLTVSRRSVSAFIDGEVLTVTADEAGFEPCVDAIRNENWGEVERLCRARNSRTEYFQKILSRFGFTIDGGYVVMNDGGEKIGLGGISTIVNRLEHLSSTGDENAIEKVGKFVDKVLTNPDKGVMNRIVEFIKFADVEIDDDGDVTTYKYVDSDYLDSHSRTLSNAPGSEVFMKRDKVNSNENIECSTGLHVCALSYAFRLWSRQKRLVKCKLNPRDIVSIPRDYKGAKIRCCRYTVLEDVTSKFLNRRIPVDFKGMFG